MEDTILIDADAIRDFVSRTPADTHAIPLVRITSENLFLPDIQESPLSKFNTKPTIQRAAEEQDVFPGEAPSFFMYRPQADNPSRSFRFDAIGIAEALASHPHVRTYNGEQYIQLRNAGLPLTGGSESPDTWLPLEAAWERSTALRASIILNGPDRSLMDFPLLERAASERGLLNLEQYRAFIEQSPSAELHRQNPFRDDLAPARSGDADATSTIIVAEAWPQVNSQQISDYAGNYGWDDGGGPHQGNTVREVQTRQAQATTGEPDTTTDLIAGNSLYYSASVAAAMNTPPSIDATKRTSSPVTNLENILDQTESPILTIVSSEVADNLPGIGAEQALLFASAYDQTLASHATEVGGQGAMVVTAGGHNRNLPDRPDWIVSTGPLAMAVSLPSQDAPEYRERGGTYINRSVATGNTHISGIAGRLQTTSTGTLYYNGASSIVPKVGAALDRLRTLPEAPNLAPELASAMLLATADPVGERLTTNAAGVQFDAQSGFGMLDPHSAPAYNEHDASNAEDLARSMVADPDFNWQDYQEQYVFAAARDIIPQASVSLSAEETAAMQAAEFRSGISHDQQLQNAAIVRFSPQAIDSLQPGPEGAAQPVLSESETQAMHVRHARFTLSMEFALTEDQQEEMRVAEQAAVDEMVQRVGEVPPERQEEFQQNIERVRQQEVRAYIQEQSPDFHFLSPAGSALALNHGREVLQYRFDETTGTVQVDGVLAAPQFFGESFTPDQQGALMVIGNTPQQQFQVHFASQEFWGPQQGADYNPFEHSVFQQTLQARSTTATPLTPEAMQTAEMQRLSNDLPVISAIQEYFRQHKVSSTTPEQSENGNYLQHEMTETLRFFREFSQLVRAAVDEGEVINPDILQEYEERIGNLPAPMQRYIQENNLNAGALGREF